MADLETSCPATNSRGEACRLPSGHYGECRFTEGRELRADGGTPIESMNEPTSCGPEGKHTLLTGSALDHAGILVCDIETAAFDGFDVTQTAGCPACGRGIEIQCPEHPDCETTVTVDGREVCAACQIERARRETRDNPPRCPTPEGCGSARLLLRTTATEDNDIRKWRCKECGHEFDEPERNQTLDEAAELVTDGGVETSRYVTVLHQLKPSENGDPGDRTVIHGKRLDDSYQLDEDHEGFVPLRRPIAVIDVGVEITEDQVTEWCNSHTGRAVLQRYWPELEVEDPTLPDCEEYLDADPELVTDGGVEAEPKADEPQPVPPTCTYEGCEADPAYIHKQPSFEAPLELPCEKHAEEGAIPLDELDFTTPGRNNPHPAPEAVNRLEMSVHQVCWWWAKEHANWRTTESSVDRESDERTVSVVIRDGDGELVSEGRLWDTKGVYALVRESEVPEDLPEFDEPPELPEWAEWVHRDPPLDHHAAGVRCTECGRENDHQFPRMPSHHRRFESWDRIRHHGDCPHASDRDVEIHEEKQVAEEIADAPDPGVMALGCIWDELEELNELRREWTQGIVEDAFRSRWQVVEDELEERLIDRRPTCPECNTEPWRSGRHDLECNCARMPDGLYDEWWHQARRLWGFVGHGDRDRGGND